MLRTFIILMSLTLFSISAQAEPSNSTYFEGDKATSESCNQSPTSCRWQVAGDRPLVNENCYSPGNPNCQSKEDDASGEPTSSQSNKNREQVDIVDRCFDCCAQYDQDCRKGDSVFNPQTGRCDANYRNCVRNCAAKGTLGVNWLCWR